MPPIVLASTSRYRAELLARLQLPFVAVAPNVDESPCINELPAATAMRLSVEKAQAVTSSYMNSLIIGSDQVAHHNSLVYGKPGTRANARNQLRAMSGKDIVFDTGLCVLDTRTGLHEVRNVTTHVGFRNLSDQEIENYLDREDALNCAGSAKSEGLGISLLRHIRGDDPNALIGLPLIALCEMLRTRGIELP
ncbi:MAG: septum formation inhibitor Maf [Rhodocyclaceae bacterium]|nr:septum formation inhibitor Maf [Rhodocyclaceae bacterium]